MQKFLSYSFYDFLKTAVKLGESFWKRFTTAHCINHKRLSARITENPI